MKTSTSNKHLGTIRRARICEAWLVGGLAFLGATWFGQCSQTTQEHSPAANAPLTNQRSFSNLTTLDGKTFKSVSVERVEPDGLEISYVPEGGGVGLAKLKFRNLPEALGRQYGYDAATSEAFESTRSRGQSAWLAENLQWEVQRQQAQAQQREQEQILREQAEAEQMRAEAVSAYAFQGDYPAVWSPGWLWWDTGAYARPPLRRHQLHNAHVAEPVSKTIAPMQPYISPMQPRGGSVAPPARYGAPAATGHAHR